MKTCLAVLGLVSLAGCAAAPATLEAERRAASSGQIGCSPSEISITDGTPYAWKAMCKSRAFHCTAAPSMACKEALRD